MTYALDTPDWAQLEGRLESPGLANFIDTQLVPQLEALKHEPETEADDIQALLALPLGLGVVGFGILFLLITWLTPPTFWGGVLEFLLFFPLFFGTMATSIYLFRDRFLRLIIDGKRHFIARSKALGEIAHKLNMIYIPAPGGAPKPLQYLSRTRLAPSVLRDLVHLLDDHGGLDEAVAITRRSGVMMGQSLILASPEQQEKYHAEYAETLRLEDGFQGETRGVAYSAFEWVEPQDDRPSPHHLVLVFTLPRRLHALTHLRTHTADWPRPIGDVAMHSMDVVAPNFEAQFDVQTSDQVEARTVFDPAVLDALGHLAQTAPMRAVAVGDHLVIDIEGEDRFALLDLTNGNWSHDSIRATLGNIADMRDVAASIAQAFRLA